MKKKIHQFARKKRVHILGNIQNKPNQIKQIILNKNWRYIYILSMKNVASVDIKLLWISIFIIIIPWVSQHTHPSMVFSTYSTAHEICTYSCCAMFCCVYIFFNGSIWLIFPYSSGLLHWHWGNHMIAPVPVKQPQRNMDKIYPHFTTTQHNTTNLEPSAYFLGCTV